MKGYNNSCNAKKCWNCMRLGICKDNQLFKNGGCDAFLGVNDVFLTYEDLVKINGISERSHLRNIKYVRETLIKLKKIYPHQTFFITLDKDDDLMFIDSRIYRRFCNEVI